METLEVQNLDTVKQRAIASYKCIQQCVAKESKTSMERGWECVSIERDSAWEHIGFKHQHDCRVYLGVSYSNWYRTMAVAQNFAKLTKAEFLTMKLSNAELLGQQEPEIRYDLENIERAGNESIEIFKTRFTFAPVDQKDKPTKFEVPMTKDKCEAIELGIKQFMSEHSIDNESYALELIVAEVRERPTLVGFVQDSIPRLTKAVMEAQDFEELRSLIVDHLRAMGELLKVCCGEDGSN